MSSRKSSPASAGSPAIALGAEIGRGGFGTVYVNADDPGMCVKVSNKGGSGASSCRQWSNEYKKIKDLIGRIGTTRLEKMKMVRIVAPVRFKETAGDCFMVLPRVYRPEGREYNEKPTIQAQLGVATCSVIHKGRGEFLGLKEIAAIVGGREDLVKAAYELGVVMGLIHFIGRNDGYDIEVYLGKEAGAKKVRFYIADFDLSSGVENLDDSETRDRLCWSLDAVPYFPRENVDSDLFELFVKGYKEIATEAGVSEEVVAEIFENYG